MSLAARGRAYRFLISGWGSDSDGAHPNMCCIRQPPSPYLEALVLCVAVWHACLVCWTEVAEYGFLARLFGWAGERGRVCLGVAVWHACYDCGGKQSDRNGLLGDLV